MKENLSNHRIVWVLNFFKTSIKLFITRTILWMIKFSVIVHLCVENSFSWWNSLFLFFNLKHQIDWYIKHTKYVLRVPCGIRIGLLCYHKKKKQQLLKTTFVTITTKFVSVSWVCQCLGYSIKSNYFPRFSLLEKKLYWT